MGVNSRIARIDHIQIAAPEGCESAPRDFYGSLLGLKEIEKPPVLKARGGCWFESGDVAVHLGVEEDFRPARKAHPALAVRDLPALEAVLRSAGVSVRPNPDVAAGHGAYIDDPFGNRIELVSAD